MCRIVANGVFCNNIIWICRLREIKYMIYWFIIAVKRQFLQQLHSMTLICISISEDHVIDFSLCVYVCLPVCWYVCLYLWFVFVSYYADKRTVNIMKTYIKRNNVEVELMRRRKKWLYSRLFLRYRPPNANQEVSNTNYIGAVYDRQGRLAAASECMACSSSKLRRKIMTLILLFTQVWHYATRRVFTNRNNVFAWRSTGRIYKGNAAPA